MTADKLTATVDVKIRPRFDSNAGLYLGLLVLFVGIAVKYSLADALIVIGAIVAAISVATSFFVTWLSRTN